MQRKAFLALREARWETLFTGHDLEVELVPANMPDLSTSKLLGVGNEHIAREICTNAFVGFRGYVDDDGQEIQNSLETRLELYGFPAVRKAIQNALEVRNYEVVTGESSAVSD